MNRTRRYTAIVTTPIGRYQLVVKSIPADAASDLREAGLSIIPRAPLAMIRVGEVTQFRGALSECYPMPHCVGSDGKQWGWMLKRVS